MENLKEIIEKLESARKEQDLSYEQVAKTINTSRQTIWKILTGLNDPNAVTFLKFIDALGFDFKIMPKKDESNSTLTFNDISRGDIPDFMHKDFIENKLKGMAKKSDIDLLQKRIPKEKKKLETKPIKKVEVSKDCPNCKYAKTQSGLTIKTFKCVDCKNTKNKK